MDSFAQNNEDYRKLSKEFDKAMDDYARIYEENFIVKLARESFHNYLKHLGISSKFILEIGCGTGEDTEFLLKYGARKVVAIDISAKAIRYTKARLEKYVKSGKLILKNIPMGKLNELGSCKFDIVIAGFGVLHHEPNIRRAIKILKDYLNPGAHLVFTVASPRHYFEEFMFALKLNFNGMNRRKKGMKIVPGSNITIVPKDVEEWATLIAPYLLLNEYKFLQPLLPPPDIGSEKLRRYISKFLLPLNNILERLRVNSGNFLLMDFMRD